MASEAKVTDAHGHDISDCKVNFLDSLDDHAKLKYFQNVSTPDCKYKFPSKTVQDGQQRKFNRSWLDKFCWLSYSKNEDGAYCKYCVFFAKRAVGKGSHENLKSLVTCKFANWKHALEVFKNHKDTEYHKAAIVDGDNFVHMMTHKTDDIQHRVDASLAQQVIQNRGRLVPIIEAIIVCGRQDIALRGHRDSGPIIVDKSDVKNIGNFRSLLKYRAKGDEKLREILEGPGKRDKYISSGIQNEIINCINDQLLRRVVQRVNAAKGFSVLADETADIAGLAQLSLCARYVSDGLQIREDFLQFVEVHDVTGNGIAKSILTALSSFGIHVSFLRGQGYDGAAAMSGAQAIIQQSHPLAVYSHCAAHNFN